MIMLYCFLYVASGISTKTHILVFPPPSGQSESMPSRVGWTTRAQGTRHNQGSSQVVRALRRPRQHNISRRMLSQIAHTVTEGYSSPCDVIYNRARSSSRLVQLLSATIAAKYGFIHSNFVSAELLEILSGSCIVTSRCRSCVSSS